MGSSNDLLLLSFQSRCLNRSDYVSADSIQGLSTPVFHLENFVTEASFKRIADSPRRE